MKTIKSLIIALVLTVGSIAAANAQTRFHVSVNTPNVHLSAGNYRPVYQRAYYAPAYRTYYRGYRPVYYHRGYYRRPVYRTYYRPAYHRPVYHRYHRGW